MGLTMNRLQELELIWFTKDKALPKDKLEILLAKYKIKELAPILGVAPKTLYNKLRIHKKAGAYAKKICRYYYIFDEKDNLIGKIEEKDLEYL